MIPGKTREEKMAEVITTQLKDDLECDIYVLLQLEHLLIAENTRWRADKDYLG